MTIKVAVAAHKPYRMPSDPVYLPLQVGAAGKQSICAPGGGAEFCFLLPFQNGAEGTAVNK